jgi:hypothetical protein
VTCKGCEAQQLIIDLLQTELGVERNRVTELHERLMARSVGEYHAAKGDYVEMGSPVPPDKQDGRFVEDDTGLITGWLPDEPETDG